MRRPFGLSRRRPVPSSCGTVTDVTRDRWSGATEPTVIKTALVIAAILVQRPDLLALQDPTNCGV